MDRRPHPVVAVAAALVTAAALVVLVVAASSPSVPLWRSPPADTRPAPLVPAAPGPTATPEPSPAPDTPSEPRPWGSTVPQLLLVLLAVAAAAVVVRAVRRRPAVPLARWWIWRRRTLPDALPEPPAELAAEVDVAAARRALASGPPDHAIVACWVQLERDAATAGLPRHESETSAEYVARVVAAASVDPRPIAELAALYREARFSRHRLTDDHLDRARAALERVVDALRTGAGVAP